MKISAIEREWAKRKMTSEIEKMTIENVSKEIEDQLQKINFVKKQWIKSKIHCNQLGTKDEAIKMIFDTNMKVLNVFMKHKNDLHTSQDPKRLKEIARHSTFDGGTFSNKKINLKI